ncbi:XrtA system polysaccharide deacetylase [Inmirania thermothiophila]
MAPYVPRAAWDRMERRVAANTHRILDLLAEHGAHATFFVLGWVAEREPGLVRRIAAEGHEVASHGWSHERVGALGPGAFRDEVRRSKALLEDLSGTAVIGYRAPSFSLDAGEPWAVPILAEAGYRYSSSLHPIRHDHYGDPHAPRFPFPRGHGLLEVPVSTVEVGGRRLPCGGGGFFRLAPYRYTRWALRRIHAEGRPAVFYLHPWELDPAQPRPRGLDRRTRVRHYLNLRRTEARLERLLRDFVWDRIDRVVALPAGALAHAC